MSTRRDPIGIPKLMLLGCLTAAACAVAVPSTPTQGSVPPVVPPASADTSFFGARSMNEQLRALDALGVDPGDARAALGRRLYFDNRLSRNGTVACATCHDVTYGFTDRRPLSMGIDKQRGRRNAPTTLNAALQERQFWDGRAATLEEQAGLPILDPIEMGFATEADAVARLAAIPEYATEFARVYGRSVNFTDLRDALAAFQRTLIFLDAPFDRWRAGDATAISPAAARGFALFSGRAGCAACHPVSGEQPLLTDHGYHNTSGGDYPLDAADQGRFEFTHDPADRGAFKTPSLRNVGITGPYLHDGSLPTLWDAVDYFNQGAALNEAEIDDLVAFLFSLTDVRLAAQNEHTQEWQRARAQESRAPRQ